MIELAVAGFGRWGKVLVDSVQGKSERVRFAAAIGRDPERIREAATARGLKALGSLDAALADPAIKGIVLATPHSQHGGEVERIARAGKAALVEKPFTLTRASAEAAVAAARAAGIVLAAAHNRRFLPSIVALKRLVEAGELGTILHIETNFSGNVTGRYSKASWRVAPGESPAGGLAGSGIHMIDSIIHLAGPIASVVAHSSQRIHDVPMDDTTVCLFKLASGASAGLTTLTATTSTYRLQVFGTKGMAEVTGLAENRSQDVLTVAPVAGGRRTELFPPLDIERAELEAFAEAIEGGRPFPVSLDDVVNGVAAFEGVSRSVAAGGWVEV